MRILITGSAGFIGSALALRLLERGDEVIGIDNLNAYYDVDLKLARLARTRDFEHFTDLRFGLEDRDSMHEIFRQYQPERVVNLAAQAGVRYSLDHPQAYVDTNLMGFANILEGCRETQVEHLVFASSSSVYGANKRMPYSVHDNVDHPLSLYAATKKANELMAHTYAHLYRIPTTGLRFFTVYGPWGRPDMSPIKFALAMVEGRKIDVYNYGNHRRDFTYIDDIVEGVVRTLDRPATADPAWDGVAPDPSASDAPYRLYNIGNNQPVELMDFIGTLERCLGVEAHKNFLPLQPGDVPDTYADVTELVRDIGYQPATSLEQGLDAFVRWFREYYKY